MVRNMYLDYRLRASTDNEVLKSRAEAADILGISESSLSNYETGKTKVVPSEMVALMSRIYNAPELRNMYCSTVCPVGCNRKIAVREPTIEQVVIHLIHGFDVKKSLKELVAIAQDGIIDESRKILLIEIGKILDNALFAISEFEILAERRGITWS